VTIPGYLARRGKAYEAVVDVPPSKREAVGRKRLRKALGTSDVHIANARLRRTLSDLHAQIDAAVRKRPETDPRLAEALELRRSVNDVRAGRLDGWGLTPVVVDYDEDGPIEEDPKDTAMGLLSDSIEARMEAIGAAEGPKRAQAFGAVAFGVSTPVTLHVDEWLAEPGKSGARRVARSVVAYRAIVATFETWAAAEGVGGVEGVTKRLAGRYVSKLHADGLSGKRISAVVSALSAYWGWMDRRGIYEQDPSPWRGQSPQKTVSAPKEDERAFTDAEVATLLTKAPDPETRDLMLLAALTGARIEELCRLTVAMCADNVFDLPGSKTAAAARRVPIHSGLAAMVAERCKGKAPTDYLLHELGTPNRFGERSAAIGKRFGRFRQTVGVHDKGEGQRRSKVNFHSWRRRFITKALQAEQPKRRVSQIVGHVLEGMTEGVYFGGDTPEALRACVEAVQLPEAAREALPKTMLAKSSSRPPPRARLAPSSLRPAR